MPLTVTLEINQKLREFPGSRGDQNLKIWLEYKGIKFDSNTRHTIDWKTNCLVWIQTDVFALNEQDNFRYLKAFEKFEKKYLSEKPLEFLDLPQYGTYTTFDPTQAQFYREEQIKIINKALRFNPKKYNFDRFTW